MHELLQAAVSPPNLLPTGLLVFVLLYWVLVIVGMLSSDTLDYHVDHAHVDVHHDFGAHHTGMGVDWLNNALVFFNLGRVPLMFWLSFVALPLWIGSILANHYLGNTSLLIGLALLVPLLVVSLIVAKMLTQPFVRLFAALEKNHEQDTQPVGKVCTVLLPTTHDRLGQASVRLSDGAPIVLNVKAASTQAQLRKGDTALVIDFDAQRRCYLIEPYAAV